MVIKNDQSEIVVIWGACGWRNAVRVSPRPPRPAQTAWLNPPSAIHRVKGARMVDGKAQFLLPGDGTIDYAKYCSLPKAKHDRGWMLVEIGRQLRTAAGDDALAAARKSYANRAPRLKAAGLR